MEYIQQNASFNMQHSDLLWIAKSRLDVSITLVPVQHKGETWYQMVLEPSGGGQAATLLNRSRTPRLWKNLSAALRFVSRTLAHVGAVTVRVQDAAGTRPRRSASKRAGR